LRSILFRSFTNHTDFWHHFSTFPNTEISIKTRFQFFARQQYLCKQGFAAVFKKKAHSRKLIA